MEPARKFKIIVNSKECGTCSGPTPSAVAKKVVKKLCGTSSKVVKFSLKECKRGCERVCGPYQGRMEKLDKPYTRSGKKITHRVVCGKVRKMRGGRDLTVENFKKTDDDGEFRIEVFDDHPYVYFGEIESNTGEKRYEFVTSIDNMWDQFHIQEIKGGEVEIIPFRKNNNEIYTRNDLISKLNKLFKYLSKLDKEAKLQIIDNSFKKLYEAYLSFDIKKQQDIQEKCYAFSSQYFQQLLNFINEIISSSSPVEPEKNTNVNEGKSNNLFSSPVEPEKNTNVNEGKSNNLSNCCTKYPANYQFSGKNKNGKPYNTNSLFRGIMNGNKRIPCKLYLYNQVTKQYRLLLTELDYLVNVNDKIVYSGLLGKNSISTRTKDIGIGISNIQHYLYCNSSNNSTKRNIDFPCWIIVKK